MWQRGAKKQNFRTGWGFPDSLLVGLLTSRAEQNILEITWHKVGRLFCKFLSIYSTKLNIIVFTADYLLFTLSDRAMLLRRRRNGWTTTVGPHSLSQFSLIESWWKQTSGNMTSKVLEILLSNKQQWPLVRGRVVRYDIFWIKVSGLAGFNKCWHMTGIRLELDRGGDQNGLIWTGSVYLEVGFIFDRSVDEYSLCFRLKNVRGGN